MRKFRTPDDDVDENEDEIVIFVKKKSVSESEINSLVTQNDFNSWCKNYVVKHPGDEPDTLSAFGLPFEESKILPYGWKKNPYNRRVYPLTQRGLAKLFVDNYRGKIRYCSTDRKWYLFDPARGWAEASSNEQAHALLDEFNDLLKYAASLIDDDDYRKRFKDRFCHELDSDPQAWTFLRSIAERTNFSASEMDTAIDILGALNGVIKLNRDGTFDFHPFSPADMITRHMAVVYDPNAKCPRWEQYLNEIFNRNQEIIHFLHMFLGQMLYGYNERKAFAIFYGPGTNNGKSTFANVLQTILGDYAWAASNDFLAQRTRSSVHDSEQLAHTKGTRLVTVPEPPQNLIVDVSLVKNLTGNAQITARFIYQNSFTFVPGFTMIIDTNHKIWMRDPTVFDRESVILFPFNEVFDKTKADPTLKDKLLQERSGILNWLLEGWAKYNTATANGTNSWVLPQSMVDALDAYRGESDTMENFLTENYEVTGNPSDLVKPDALYQTYRSWSYFNGDQAKSKKVFLPDVTIRLSNLLRKKLGITGTYDENLCKYKDSHGTRYYWGITLK